MLPFATLLDAAFGHPRGVLGRLGGAVVARGNATRSGRPSPAPTCAPVTGC